jgi:hypothetical protein
MNQHEQLRSLASRIEALHVEPLHADDYAVGPTFLMYDSPSELEVNPSLAQRFASGVSTLAGAVFIAVIVVCFMLLAPAINL